uniref:NACHT domain protein n=1 Tax=uncultured Thiotrichaceae bacterium TaxID=298394 RepID=A0A6S6SFP6_9GAMM|nr:MAG: NACHT domain protein [uncultured Thiotrichaceae bacterium]
MTEPTGASESNAGDDFHINWSCLRAIDLINPRKNLVQVKIEGLAEEDLQGSDPTLFLTADLTEYFSGNSDLESISLPSVDRVVISQLKYSTRHATTEWTAARLCEKKGTKIQRSVISRFADSFLELSTKYGRDEVLKKLRVKLVSNQPISSSLLALLKDANDFLTKSNGSEVQYAQLKRKMTEDHLENLERLKKATNKLKSSQFTDFLRVICFEDCNAENRISIRNTLAGKVSHNFIRPSDTDPALLNLIQQVSQQALPSHKPLSLSKESIFQAFGVHDDYALFPAPPLFEKVSNTITRSYSKKLADQIIANTSEKMTLAHGVAGIGKTTVLQSIHEHLPQDSEVILYDCYGRGDYRKSKEERHSHERALQQLANEMSLKLGSDWLIKLPSRLEDLQRGFNQRLDMAASFLPNKDALLVIVIDAADNSIFASKEAGSNCFVPTMWELDLPDNARLVMSARTGARATSLQALENTELFPIEGFAPQESEEHVKQFFPQASSQQCAEFHEQTYGVPSPHVA